MIDIDISLVGFYRKNNFGDDKLEEYITKFFDTLGFSSVTQEENDWNLADIVVIGGGGLITPYFWIFKNIDRLILLRKKILIFNVNLTREADPIVKKLKELNALWIVRDYYSVEYLKSNNIVNNVYFAPDICFSEFEDGKDINDREKIISVCCNYYIFKNIFSDRVEDQLNAQRAYHAIKNFLFWMSSFDWKIQLIPAQIAETIDDRVTNSYLHGLLSCESINILNGDNDKILKHLSDSSFIISSRYHFSIFALSNNIPLIDITHHSKNANLLKDIGLQNLSNNYYTLLKDDLIRATKFFQNSLVYSNIINKFRVNNGACWTGCMKYIIDFLVKL